MKALLFGVSFLFSLSAWPTNHFVIETRSALSVDQQARLERQIQGKLIPFSASSGYFSRVYSTETTWSALQLTQLQGVVRVESVSQIETYAVIPNPKTPAPTQDPLSVYQWALQNHGQVVTVDVDDITTHPRPGLVGADVQLGAVQSLKLERNPLVAVIDYGVDLNHPDLKAQIFQNSAECGEDGTIPLNPKEDKDNNGFIGDCQGWNFTSEKGTNRVIDDTGHGTHVAGIIAALSNNELGISGVHSQIRILPLQVLKKTSSGRDFSSRSDWLARAILYAVKMKADVINMSLGWPLFLDQKHLREAVKEALKAGVVVVAAAGNNNHSAPIFPCAYDGVLCVGSINNDGSASAFSNFGSHVDLLAPGDQILSLLPMNMQPDFFSVQGYEIKSGTSQAAPYVSALAALLKAKNPEHSSRQILAQLLTTAKPLPDSKKHFAGGLIQMTKALSASATALVRPVFKETRLALVNTAEKSFRIEIPVENLSSSPGKAEILITSENADIQWKKNLFSLNLDAWQTEKIVLVGSFSNLEASNQLRLKVQIQTAQQIQSYLHDVELARDISQDPEVVRIALPAEISKSLRTISARGLSNPKKLYYVQVVAKDKTTLTLYELQANQFHTLGQLELPFVQSLLSFVQTDKNQNGLLDFEIQAVLVHKTKDEKGKEQEEKSVQFFHFDEQLKPLWGSLSVWKFNVESALLPQQQVEGLQLKHPELGALELPVFFAQGTTPKADQNQDPFTQPDLSVSTRLYYLTPSVKDGVVTLKTRILDSEENISAWRKQLKLSFFKTIDVLFQLKGQKLILSVGEGFQRDVWLMSYRAVGGKLKFDFQSVPSQNVLNGYFVDEMIDLQFGNKVKNIFVGQYSPLRWDILGLDQQKLVPLQSLVPSDRSESLQVYIKSFTDMDQIYSFVQTPSEVLLQTTGPAGTRQQTYPFHVSTFISQDIFSERAFPAVTELGGKVSPALLIDSSQITAQHIFLLTTDGKKLIVPIRTSLHLPNHCQAMNPLSATKESSGKFLFLCELENKKMELWSLSM
jgi:cell wall-associated protease